MNERSFEVEQPLPEVAKESAVSDNAVSEEPSVAKHAKPASAKSANSKKPAARKPRAKTGADLENKDRILAAAEKLFSTQGFHGTGLREVAETAGVSLGNIYNHFADKEALFEALLQDLETKYLDPSQPLVRALLEAEFPAEIEKLGVASGETVKKFASYIRLIYVDVIEFEGKHVRRLYGGMRERYEAVYGERVAKLKKDGKLSEANPVIAAMMCTMTYMFYFTIEHLFGVKHHFGMSDEQVIQEFAKVFRLGILKR